MNNKNILVLLVLVIFILCGVVLVFSFNVVDVNNTTNNSSDLNTTDNNTTGNVSDFVGGDRSNVNSKVSNSKVSSSDNVEEQEFSYTRDQPTKVEHGVRYKLIYDDKTNKPSYWQSTDGKSDKLPLSSKSRSSAS